ncbi:MAG: ABC transporter permease [Acidimicrobiaceae bacterium]|nr:ABC transporter permease [Ilumatobacter sp.]MCB9381919.1 ABC transporter permease [Acidimicrobiaceae bacterium]MCO5328674.1 ABC transporter permease [Ilumatobacteraceae bacterium]
MTVPWLTRVRLAAGDLRAQPWRSVIAVLVLTPLAASWFILAVVARSLADLGTVGEARNLVVTEPDVFDLANVHLDGDDLATAAAAAGDDAESVTPLVLRLVEMDERVLQLRAAATGDWAPIYDLTLLDGTVPDGARDEMAITSAVQVATGWQVGDRQQVFGTDFTITAVLRGSGSKVASLWLPLDRAERLFDRPGEFQFAVVRVRADADGDAVRARLRDAFPGRIVLDESAIQAEAARGVRSLGDIAMAFTAVGVLGLAVGAANATALTLAERRRSVGLLRAMGFDAATVRGLLAARAVLTSLVAVLLGLAAATWFVQVRPTFVLRTYTVSLRLEPWVVLAGVALAVLGAWAGAIVAARRAVQATPATLVVT